MEKFCIVFVTAKNEEEGKNIQEQLVKEKLAACVNSLPVESCYTWKGKMERESEVLLIMKTKTSLFEKLAKRVKELHSYDVPEIIALPILKGSEGYLKWIDEVTE